MTYDLDGTALKNQAALAKRTSTALAQLSRRLTLSDAERATLQKASAILEVVGSKVKVEAKRVKREEAVRAKAIAAADIVALKLVSAWPQETILDKVSIVCGDLFGEENLWKYLAEKHDKEIFWYFNTLFDSALRNIAQTASYNSVKNGKDVVEVMNDARVQLDKIRGKQSVIEIAKQLEAKAQVK